MSARYSELNNDNKPRYDFTKFAIGCLFWLTLSRFNKHENMLKQLKYDRNNNNNSTLPVRFIAIESSNINC